MPVKRGITSYIAKKTVEYFMNKKKKNKKDSVGGPTGSYFGTKTYKQKLDLADPFPTKKQK